jgi:hypothetical protein
MGKKTRSQSGQLLTIQEATLSYERWLGRHLTILPPDLDLKHKAMTSGPFPFLRATFYRWVQRWPIVCKGLADAPRVLAVGDLHVENFGTWRDREGRLVWGINDFDEAWHLPYTADLLRLATSAHLAIRDAHFKLKAKDACSAILEGYVKSLETGGRPVVLAEDHRWLHDTVMSSLRDPATYWTKLEGLPEVKKIPKGARRSIEKMFPESGLEYRVMHRVAGLGSLGRKRYLALAEYRGGKIAREAKALAPSACLWADGEKSGDILYQDIIDSAVRAVDPYVELRGRWIVRRLAPDCSRIELSGMPKERDETRLLHAMGFETANIHLGSRKVARTILADLAGRRGHWLHEASTRMLEDVDADWRQWRDTHVPKAAGARA